MKRAKNATRTTTVPTSPSAKDSGATTVTVPVLAPRNPYQALARQRKAGAHDLDARKRRRIEKDELRKRIVDE